MKSFWLQSREVVVILGMIGLFSALVYFGIFRVLERNREGMISIQQAIVDRKMLEEQRSVIATMRDEVDRIRLESDKLDVFLPKDRIISLVEALESIGNDLGVSIVSEASSPQALAVSSVKKKPTKKASVSEEGEVTNGKAKEEKKEEEKEAEALLPLLPEDRSVFITFKVTGEYDRVLAFLRKLDTMPFLLDVLSIQMEQAVFEDDQSSVSPSISGDVRSPFRSSSPLEVSGEKPVEAKKLNVEASFHTVIYTDR